MRIGRKFKIPEEWWFKKVGNNIDDEQVLKSFLPTFRKLLAKYYLPTNYDQDCLSIISDFCMTDEELLE